MRLLDLTLPTAAENVALDEALLNVAEDAGDQPGIDREVLRIWEPSQFFVVVGRSSRVAEEVDLGVCQQRGIPIVRRASGGSAVVAGPGCLMYAVVLAYHERSALRIIEEAHRYVLGQMVAALQPWLPDIERRGISDLVWQDRKISGNSLRCCRSHLLYHGTLLYNFPLELVSTFLRSPQRQPEYRRGREHREFIANAPLDVTIARQRIALQWNAREMLQQWPAERVRTLLEERYLQDHWNLRI